MGGPRQVGKTTLVQQVIDRLDAPSLYVSADEPALRDAAWLAVQWQRARDQLTGSVPQATLVVDEIQKVAGWAESVKRLWDEDTRAHRPLHVVLLGSAPLLMQRGLTESLAGRFETMHLGHWSLAEMHAAFGWNMERYLHFGGYPGAAPLAGDVPRWRSYVLNSIVETTISRDVLLMAPIEKPALLRRLFELGCRYSGQVLSYTKMLGQLLDAGNTTTLAHYLDLLAAAGMLTGLQKYSGSTVRQRGSSPKLQVLNTALMTAQAGLDPVEARESPGFRGRLVESAVGSHLANAAAAGECTLTYWRDRNRDVDFVLQRGARVAAIEVKSGTPRGTHPGLAAFSALYDPARTVLVGADGVPIEEFLRTPVGHWL